MNIISAMVIASVLTLAMIGNLHAAPVVGEYCDSRGNTIKFTAAGKWRTSSGMGGTWELEDEVTVVLESTMGFVLEGKLNQDIFTLNDPNPVNGKINKRVYRRGPCGGAAQSNSGGRVSSLPTGVSPSSLEARIAKAIENEYNCPGVSNVQIISRRKMYDSASAQSSGASTEVFQVNVSMSCLSPQKNQTFYVSEDGDGNMRASDRDLYGYFRR